MVSKTKIVRCAKIIVKSMNLKNDSVLIMGGSHTQSLLEEIGFECYKIGSHPLIISTGDDYAKRIYSKIPKEILEITPKHYLGAIKNTDAIIRVEQYKDPRIRTKFKLDKVEAFTKANIPIRKILYGETTGRGKKWLYSGWPTLEISAFYGLKYDDLERLIIDGMLVPPDVLKKNIKRLAGNLKNADILHITDSKGTDFTCRIKNRRINEGDGIIDDHDVEMNDLGNNLPDGEVFIAPYETFGEGKIFCPITNDRFTNKIIRNVTLQFKNGRLILEKCTAEDNGKIMIETFKSCLKIDKNNKIIRTTNIAELGIGCNPAINNVIGYILTDEKIMGSIHLAFGSNFSYGGSSKSCMHWDFVTDPSVTIEKIDTKEIIMKNGKII